MKGVPPPIVPLSDRLHDTRTPLLLEISRGFPLECHKWPEDIPNITQRLLRHLREYTDTHNYSERLSSACFCLLVYWAVYNLTLNPVKLSLKRESNFHVQQVLVEFRSHQNGRFHIEYPSTSRTV